MFRDDIALISSDSIMSESQRISRLVKGKMRTVSFLYDGIDGQRYIYYTQKNDIDQ